MTTSANRILNGNTLGGRCIAFFDNAQNPPTVPTNQSNTYFPNVYLELTVDGVTITVTPPPNSTAGSTGVRIERDMSNTFSAPNVVWDSPATYTIIDVAPGSGTWYYRIGFRNGDAVLSAYSEGRSIFMP
jgi:hypothetical protein